MSDIRGVLSHLNRKRLSNASKILRSYYASRWTGNPMIKGLPISMSVEPTTTCNLQCPECPSGLRQFSRNTGNLDPALFKQIVDQVGEHTAYMTLYFQGEPYINPNFNEMVSMANSRGIYTSTSSNGHFLSESHIEDTIDSGLDKLIISMDGVDQETYEKYRINGKLNKVLEGIERLEARKKERRSKTPFTELQFIVFRHNEHQLPEMRRLHGQLGSDKLVFKTAQIYNVDEKPDFIPTNEKHSRYKMNGKGTFQIKNKLLDHCWRMWHSCVITWDGKVVPCCFDKDATYVMGDLREDSFETIWHNEKYQHFRASLLKSRKDIDICRNCTEGTKVWI